MLLTKRVHLQISKASCGKQEAIKRLHLNCYHFATSQVTCPWMSTSRRWNLTLRRLSMPVSANLLTLTIKSHRNSRRGQAKQKLLLVTIPRMDLLPRPTLVTFSSQAASQSRREPKTKAFSSSNWSQNKSCTGKKLTSLLP